MKTISCKKMDAKLKKTIIIVGSSTAIGFLGDVIMYSVAISKGQKFKIATIDTMFSFYLSFLYTNRPYYIEFSDRILCMSKFLFEVQQKNRLKQKGLLKRFSITCYGHQESIEEMRGEKASKYREMRDKKGTPEYNEYFLSYKPEEV